VQFDNDKRSEFGKQAHKKPGTAQRQCPAEKYVS